MYSDQRKRTKVSGRLKRVAKARVKEMRAGRAMTIERLYGPGPCSKLNHRVAMGICRLLAQANTLELSARMNGVAPNTMWQWIRAGEAEPDGPYGQFARDVAYAQDLAHKRMVKKLVDHDDWKATSFILKNRYPKLYRDRIEQEVSGPDGGPVTMAVQSFNVVLELHRTDDNNESGQRGQPERKFRIDTGPAAAMQDLA